MRHIASIVLFIFPLALVAQQFVVKGVLQDSKTLEPLEYATVTLLRADTIVGRSSVADEEGRFVLKTSLRDACVLRFSYVGYQPRTLDVVWASGKDTVDVGIVGLVSKDNNIGMATVTATAAKVEQKGDTTMFNAAAYRVPEGSTLEALVALLPGVEVSDDGKITWNGKEITELLINGKDFFKGDTQVAMKNLPTNLVSKIKAYEKKSDYTEQTGIDDGEETSVLDISTKRALNESWVTNADLAYGTESRYAERLFVSRFTEKSYVSAYGNLNNVNNRGFGGPRGFGNSGGGLVSTKNGGMSFSWDNGRDKNGAGRFEIGGHVRAEHRSTDNLSTSVSETFLTGNSGSSFSNSRNQSYGKSTSVRGDFRLRWNPDSLTSIMIRPNFSYSLSHNSGRNYTATFRDDPYAVDGVDDPLEADESDEALEAITVNRNRRNSLSDGTSYSLGLSMNVTRKLNSLGRNVNFRGNLNHSSTENNAFSLSEISYPGSERETTRLNQYTSTPSKNMNYSLRVGYAEPLGNNWFAEARYEFGYRYQDSDRTLRIFDYDSGELPPPLGYKPTEADYLLWVRDENNSRYATYRTYNNYANIGVRYNSSSVRFNAGMDFQPQTTKMDYERPGQHIDTVITRHVFHVAPTVRLRYNFSKTNRIDLNYRGSSSEPSMTDLLAVVDDTDPLNISMGNPGLKPSWANSFSAEYNGYNTERQQGITSRLNFLQSSNSISSRMVYDQTTGVRYVRPDNINGNWSASGEFVFNTPLDYDKLFTVTTHSSLSYRNQVGYVSVAGGRRAVLVQDDVSPDRDYAYYSRIFDTAASQKNTTRTLGARENLTLSYRRDWYDVSVFGNVNYNHSRATARENGNLDTWQYAYGVRGNLTFGWGMSFSTDLSMNSRRGYADASMNTNELIWNVQLSQSFLKDRNAIVSLQAYDLLRQQSSVSRTINALQRSDSWTNAIHSYLMVHFIYRLNIFGGAKGGPGSGSGGERRGGPGMLMRGGGGGRF